MILTELLGHFPGHNAYTYRYIQGMFGAALWNFYGDMSILDYIITYSIYFIAKDQTVFFILVDGQLIQGDAVGGLFDDDHFVSLIAQGSGSLCGTFQMFPFYRGCCSKGSLFNFPVRWSTGNSGEVDFFDT